MESVPEALDLVVLAEASEKYGRTVTSPRFTAEGFSAVPFNETSESKCGVGPSHWYELPLACEKVKRDTGLCIKGRLFTSCMPRNVDEDWPETSPDGSYPAWLTDANETDPNVNRQLFKIHVAENGICNILALVEDREPPAGRSTRFGGLRITLLSGLLCCVAQRTISIVHVQDRSNEQWSS
ncbi:unnamed protein product [Prorocentrum cordatum]|uniref:Uncharacterized protein n=1 Tax=Prorocentrum cordatum TaxID=2364126 RepID=A0ABN9U7F6_9DINO|nr:unnamed protein product [Polarella glacialis]